MADRPDWCTWWTSEQWLRFAKLLRLVDRQGVLHPALDHPGDPEAAAQRELRQLAEKVRDAAPGRWTTAIKDHLAGAPATAGAPAVGDDELSRLRVLVVPQAETARLEVSGRRFSPLARSLGADLVEMLVVDGADTISKPDKSHFDSWGIARDRLFELGRGNVRAEPVDRGQSAERGIYTLTGPSYYVAARLGMLRKEPDTDGPYGVLVAVPNQHALAYHPMRAGRNSGFPLAFGRLGRFSRDLIGLEGARPISDKLYWWRAGQLTEIPVSFTESDAPEVKPPSRSEPRTTR